MTNAAIQFEPDGYVLDGPKLMGRQAAGNAFLRGAVAGLRGETLWAYTAKRDSATAFARIVRAVDPAATAAWLPPMRFDVLGRIGTLYLPGPNLRDAARLRLRAGADAWSLVGVTHTTASHGAMDSVTGLLSAPVMPWDALVCTSAAVAGTVDILLEAEADYLRWRFGMAVAPPRPSLPVIPLGVHCADFAIPADERATARQALGIAPGTAVALFVGRLSFHAKAHPHAVYIGLGRAAAATGAPVALIQCGWFANDHIETAFRDGGTQFAPSVRTLFADGRDAALRRQAWAAADIFVSLSDNIQETFGLAPIEAMAAGLPAVVTDWDGYKDTVREGIDGFRIPTRMPGPDTVEPFALGHEAGADSYDLFCGLTSRTVSVDHERLAARLADLIGDAALRARMGAAARARARAVFDWPVVFRQYRDLWAALGERRRSAAADPAVASAPRVSPARTGPFRAFAHYPTAPITAATTLTMAPDASPALFAALTAHPLFSYAGRAPLEADVVTRVLAALEHGPRHAADVGGATGLTPDTVILAAAVLAKMGLLTLA